MMEETLINIARVLIPGIILSIFTAVITVRLSIKRFSYERLWERKLDSYSEIFEALYNLKDYYQIKRDIDVGDRSIKTEKAVQIEQQWTTNDMEVNKAIDIGSLVISQDSINCLKELRNKPRMDPEDNPIFELASTEIKYLDDCICKLISIAQKDLKISRRNMLFSI